MPDKEKLTFEIIFDEETKCLKNAISYFPDTLRLTDNLNYELLQLFTKIKVSNHLTSMLYSPIQKLLYLSSISLIRKHTYQANLNLRLSLEYYLLFLYSMSNPSFEQFLKKNDIGRFIHNDKVKLKAYKWLNDNYLADTENFQYLKKYLDNTCAHANINNTTLNYEINDNTLTTYYFDKISNEIIELNLIGFCNLAVEILRLINTVNLKYKVIDIEPNFLTKLDSFDKEVDKCFDSFSNNHKELISDAVKYSMESFKDIIKKPFF